MMKRITGKRLNSLVYILFQQQVLALLGIGTRKGEYPLLDLNTLIRP